MPNGDEPEDKKPSLAERIKSRLNFSLAAIVSALVGLILTILAVTAWFVYSLDPTRIAWGDYMSPIHFIGLIALGIFACASAYVAVRVWMSNVPAGDQSMRAGWEAGRQLLSRHSVQLSDLPCFVVLGCQTRHEQERWVGSEGFHAAAQPTEITPAIDWHINEDRILVFCREIGVYGGLLNSIDSSGVGGTAQWIGDPTNGQPTALAAGVEGTTVVTAGPEASALGSDAETDSSGQPCDGDETCDDFPGDVDFRPSNATATATTPTTATRNATQNATQPATVTDAMQTLNSASALVRDAQRVVPRQPESEFLVNSLSSVKTTARQNQLSQLCMRLKASRYPHAAINGTLVVVDSPSLLAGQTVARRLGRAIRSDLDQLKDELGVSSPVTMMVADRHQPNDFPELCRRLGMAGDQSPAAPASTFPGDTLLGGTFESEEIPTAEAMNVLTEKAINNMQNRVNRLFLQANSLSQPRNHQLVRTLIQCRRWRRSLQALMVESCAVGTDGVTAAATGNRLTSDTPIVSGLFFGAPEISPTVQRFTRAVFQRMVQQQNHLAWTIAERKRWAMDRRMIAALSAVTLILAFVLAVQLWMLL